MDKPRLEAPTGPKSQQTNEVVQSHGASSSFKYAAEDTGTRSESTAAERPVRDEVLLEIRPGDESLDRINTPSPSPASVSAEFPSQAPPIGFPRKVGSFLVLNDPSLNGDKDGKLIKRFDGGDEDLAVEDPRGTAEGKRKARKLAKPREGFMEVEYEVS